MRYWLLTTPLEVFVTAAMMELKMRGNGPHPGVLGPKNINAFFDAILKIVDEKLTAEPPAPLSHMWLLPMAEGSEGLRWTRGSGWAVLAV